MCGRVPGNFGWAKCSQPRDFTTTHIYAFASKCVLPVSGQLLFAACESPPARQWSWFPFVETY